MLTEIRTCSENHNPSDRPTSESSVFLHPQLRGFARQIANRRRAWWQGTTTHDVAELVLISDFISRDGGQFLVDTARDYPDSFDRRVYSRMDNRSRSLFQKEFCSPRRSNGAAAHNQVNGLDLSQLVDHRSLDSDPSKTAERNDLIEALRNAIEVNLNATEINVIDQLFFRNQSLKATALILNCKKAKVRRIKRTAIAKLHRALSPRVNTARLQSSAN